MRHRLRFTIACGFLLAATTIAYADVAPKDAARANELYKKAQDSTKTNLDGACDLFAESLQLAPSIRTRLALAECRQKQGRAFDAYLLYDAAATEAILAQDAKQERFASEHAAALAPKLVRVTLQIASPNAAGLEIRIGDRKLAYQQWKQVIVVAPGAFVVDASAPDHAPVRLDRTAAAGEEVMIDIPQLVPAQVTGPAAPVAMASVAAIPEITPRMRKARRLALIGGAILGASLLIAIHAKSRYEDAADQLDVDGVTSAQYQADFATLVGVGGIVVASIGLWQYRKAKRERGLVAAPTVTATTAGAAIVGWF